MTTLFDPPPKELQLRDYQLDVVNETRDVMAAGVKRVLIHAVTGSGKTECAAAIIKAAMKKNKRVAFMANRIHLVQQTARRLSDSGIDCGVIQGENTYEPWRSILVCSIDTIARRGMPNVDLIIVDEAHACGGTKAYRKIMEGKHVIGLTGTPYSKGLGKKYDSLGGPLFEKVVRAISMAELIKRGWLVTAEVWAPGEPDLSSVKVVAGEYDAKELGEAVDKPQLYADIVSNWVRLGNGEPTVVFATNIAHSKHICADFNSIGAKFEHLDHRTPDEERVAMLSRVESGETIGICNVGVLCEGWDFPRCRNLILACPTKSLVRYLQKAGRVLRPFPGKEFARIFDHAGIVKRLGFPWDSFDQPLDDGTPKNGSAAKPKQEPLPKPCPQCSFMKPLRTPICPMCGFESQQPNKIEVEDGELVQLTGKNRKPRLIALAELGKQEVYSQLLDYAFRHNYSTGWVAHKYREVFNVWPRSMEESSKPTGLDVSNWIRSQNIKFHKSRGVA